MKENDDYAFPSHGTMGEVAQQGMTLRDYFAAKAMNGMLVDMPDGGEYSMSELARDAYEVADTMLAERSK